jgi:uncharacterized metal-binding protein YceD (DUF177 family)
MNDSHFSVAATVAEIRRRAEPFRLAASAEECGMLASRLGLVEIADLVADIILTPDGDAVNASGRVSATVTQSCVATGEPVVAAVDAPVLVRFVPNARLEVSDPDAEVELATDDLDIIGYADNRIEIGAMAIDTLALALDPYPRRADADEWLRARGVISEGEAGAFGMLAELRDKLRR